MKISLIAYLVLASCSCRTVPIVDDDEPMDPVGFEMPQINVSVQPAAAVKNKIINGFMMLSLNGSVDDASMNPLVRALSDNTGLKGYILEINSGGGYVHSGFRLVKAMENSGVPVHCIVDGHAQSMAFYILQACDTRSMTKRSFMMIHNPSMSGGGGGDFNWYIETAEELLAMQNGMMEHYLKRMHVTKKQLQDRLAIRNWYLGWEEGMDVGALDHALDDFDHIHKIAANFKKK